MRIDRVKFISELARRDMTVKHLTELSGVSRPTISSVRGGKSCHPDTAAKLAKALGINVTELLEG